MSDQESESDSFETELPEDISFEECDRIVAEHQRELDKLGDPEKRLWYRVSGDDRWSWFNAVDMKLNPVSTNIVSTEKLQHLKQPIFDSIDSVVYTVGYKDDDDDKSVIAGFRFDLDSPDLEWTELLNLEFSPNISPPIFYKSKIYAFTHEKLEGYNPIDNLPSLKRLEIPDWPQTSSDFHVISSDTSSNRILIYFLGCGLYALYPDDETLPLICLDSKFSGSWWSPLSAIVDNVLYLQHCGGEMPVVAYDLEKRKLLDVEWNASRCFGTPYKHNLWSGFYHLGDGILCLARSYTFVNMLSGILKSIMLKDYQGEEDPVHVKIEADYFKVEKDARGESIVASPGPTCGYIHLENYTSREEEGGGN